MKVISLVNQKGGVAKTTSVVNIGAGIANCGYSVLLIDLDPQGNLSTSLGVVPEAEDVTTYEVLKGADINQAIKSKNNYDVLPVDIRLSRADLELASVPGRDVLLKEAIEGLKKKYDYVIIDCAPSLNILALMALTASNEVIIPVKADYLALNGLAQLNDTLELVKKRLNPKLNIGGVIITFYDGRRGLDQAVIESARNTFKSKVYNTCLSNNVKLAEAPSYGKDIYEYAPGSKGATQYTELVAEILNNETTKRRGKK